MINRKRKPFTITLDPGDIDNLDELAIAFNCLWGDRANPSELIRQIAQGEILLSRPGDLPKAQGKKTLKLLKVVLTGAKAIVDQLEKIVKELE